MTRKTDIDQAFRDRMLADERFQVLGEETINDEIDDAMNNVSRFKWTDMNLYVQRWLRTAVKWHLERHPETREHDPSKVQDEYDRWREAKAVREASDG